MAQLTKIFHFALSIIFVAFVSFNSYGSIENPIDGDKTEKVSKVDKNNTTPQSLKSDSLSQTKLKEANKSTTVKEQSKEKKVENSSMLSYNLVFYLMYKFKVNEIFNLADKKNETGFVNENTLYIKGKRWLEDKISKIHF